MGLSVASLNPIHTMAYVSPQQQAYSIDNESAVSSAYRESIGNTATPQAVRGASPVVYANTKLTASAVDSQMVANQRAHRAYNAVANSFEGVNTTYDRAGGASAYTAYGQNVDAYA